MADRWEGYTPTPEEIAAACLRIQATWSDAERERRLVFKVDIYTIPVCEPDRKAAYLYDQSDAGVLGNYLPFTGRNER